MPAVLIRNATPSIFHQRHIRRCCDHRETFADDDLFQNAIENISWADALLFGRVTYEMMEGYRRPLAFEREEHFARTIDAAKKYVVSTTLDRVDWNAELVLGDLGKALQSKHVDLKFVSRLEFGSGAVAMRYEARR